MVLGTLAQQSDPSPDFVDHLEAEAIPRDSTPWRLHWSRKRFLKDCGQGTNRTLAHCVGIVQISFVFDK